MHKLNFNFTRIFNIIAIALVLSFVFSQFFTKAQAAIGINRQINFQGKLVNNPLSTNVSNTNYTVVFTLYDNASGGTQLWQETQTVSTTDGIFRVALGSITPFPANFNFNWSGLYLGIKVNSDSEMTPRIQMAAVPFAFNAEKVSGLTVQDTSGNASTSGTLQIANAKTVSFADAFTTSGAFPLTLTTTGTTNATIPSGTVTLVDLSTTQSLTNKTIGSTGLTFSGATTDITTISNEDLTLTPNGSGNIVLTGDFDSQVLIGGSSTSTEFPLFVNNGIGNNSAFVVNNLNNGNLLAASASGATRFTVSNAGLLSVLGGLSSDIDTLTATTLKIGASTANALTLGNNTVTALTFNVDTAGNFVFQKEGSAFSCSGTDKLTLNGSGQLVCSTDQTGGGTGVNWWNQLVGAISPVSINDDFLIGGTATSTAKFSYTGIQSGQTISSVSGQLIVMANNGYGGNASISGTLTLGAFSNGVIQTTRQQGLTIGGDTTGFITIDSNTNVLNLADSTINLTGSAPVLGAITTNAALQLNANGAGTLTLQSGATGNIQLFSSSNTISSAGNLTLAGTAGITLSGNGADLNFTGTGLSTITTAASQNFAILPGAGGLIGINTGANTPLSSLDIRTNSATGGTISVASVSGQTSFANLVANNDGVGDLFTASKSGLPIFTVRNNGQLTLGAPYYTAGCTALETNSAGTLVCGTDDTGGGSGSSPFAEISASGVIVPNNSTVDFLVGGQATASALFAIKGVAAGTPIATLSATTNGNGIVLSGSTSTIQSLKNNALILGGDTTGDIQLKPGTGMVFIGDNEVKSGGLTFYSSGVGETDASIITDATGNLIFSAPTGTVEVGSGTGNISLEGDADTSIVASFIGIPAADMFQITNTGQAITANGVDGLALAYVLGGSSAVTNAGLTVDLTTTNNNASTVLRGINIGNITGQASATEVGLRIGTGWDSGISVESGGITIAAGALAVNSDSITADGATLTINAGGAVDIQDGLTVDSLTIDTGDITWSGTTPTITINAAETFTISNGTAADNFTYNTSTNALIIGDGTNGLTFDIDTGMIYQGSGRKTKTITLSPEYAGAIISASGSATTNGSMTSDASPSANFRTYYEWTSTQTSLQDYTIAIRSTLPSDFGAWTTSSTTMQVNFNTGDTSALANKLDVFVYNPSTSTSTPVVYRQARVSGTDKTWTTVDIANTDLEDSPAWNTAGQTAVIYLKVYGSGTYNYTQVGDITLNYLSAF